VYLSFKRVRGLTVPWMGDAGGRHGTFLPELLVGTNSPFTRRSLRRERSSMT